MAEPSWKFVSGLRELNDALAKLPQNIGKNVLRGAVYAASRVVRDEAKIKAAPLRKTGTLHRAIYVKHIRERSNVLRQEFKVGVRHGKKYQAGQRGRKTSSDAYYAAWVEYGHFTRTDKKRMSRKRDANMAADFASGAVRWVAARPFMRPAWDAKKMYSVDEMARYIRVRLPKEVARVAKRPSGLLGKISSRVSGL